MISEFFAFLETQTADRGCWSINMNDHRSVYQTAEQVIGEYENHEDFGPTLDFQTPELRQRAIDTNTIYYLQWYRQTPVAFYSYAAPTLEDLARWVLIDDR